MDYIRLTASEVVALTKNGRITVEEYAKALLDHITKRDPIIHAWAFLDADLVLNQAKALDQIPADQRGPLHGVAVGVKDVILTKDMPTQHFSPLYKDDAPKIDAAPVSTLRSMGALILGKTNTTEFAAVTTAGPTCNPHDPARTPGGSSSGSGAVVGDFQCPIALGTQTGGSTIRPGSYNGICAMKPTWGAISREGLKQYSMTCDTLGLYARSIADLQLLAEVFQMQDDQPLEEHPFSLKAAKVGIVRGPNWHKIGSGSASAMDLAIKLLEAEGAIIEEVKMPAEFAKVDKWHANVLDGEGRSSFLADYYKGKDLLDPFIVEHVEKPIAKLSRQEQLESYDGCSALRPVIDKLFNQYSFILSPSVADEAPLGLLSTGNAAFNLQWTIMQVPVINVPGFIGANDMPIGLSMIAARYRESRLCAGRYISLRDADDIHLLHAARTVEQVFAKGGGWFGRNSQ